MIPGGEVERRLPDVRAGIEPPARRRVTLELLDELLDGVQAILLDDQVELDLADVADLERGHRVILKLRATMREAGR